MPRIYSSDNESNDFCKDCFPNEDEVDYICNICESLTEEDD